ncbi:aliphatic glucosinolate S-oxygenase [Trifolium repens]|nr:aliphatic glucosinolate S-oxygenase [Trifolium repens]WJX26689.1 aliphatic glucosinolate S-oxygenase [Trifolium repens]
MNNKTNSRTTLIPVRKTPTLRRGRRRPESGKTQNRHQPPKGLDASQPHDPCGPEIDGKPEDDGERLGKREEAWTVGGKGLPLQTNYHHHEGVDADGSSIHADAIIHCTGYKYHIPFLETSGILTIEDNRVGPLYKHVFPPSLAPWLSFVGLIHKEATFNVVELQAKWVAKVLSGKILLPTEEEMMESVKEFYQFMEENGFPKHHTHSLRPFQSNYKHWLVEQIGLPPLENWKDDMLMECLKNILIERNEMYRDEWDDNHWDAIIHNDQLLKN